MTVIPNELWSLLSTTNGDMINTINTITGIQNRHHTYILSFRGSVNIVLVTWMYEYDFIIDENGELWCSSISEFSRLCKMSALTETPISLLLVMATL